MSQVAYIEKATTNYLINPHATPNLTSGWFAQDCSMERDTVDVPEGATTSVHCACDGSTPYAGVFTQSLEGPNGSWDNGTTLSGRAWLKGSGNVLLTVFVWSNSYASQQATHLLVELPDEWTDYTNIIHTIAGVSTAISRVDILVHPGAVFGVPEPAEWWIALPQIEEGDYSTSVCPQLDGAGDPLPGYTWAGTAHASPSSRTAGAITTELTDHIDPTDGEFVTRFDTRLDDLAVIMQAGTHNVTGTDYFDFSVQTNGTLRFTAATRDGGGTLHSASCDSAAGAITADTAYAVSAFWDADSIGIQIGDDDPITMARAVAPEGAWDGDTLRIGHANFGGQINGRIGPVVTQASPLSAVERQHLIDLVAAGNYAP